MLLPNTLNIMPYFGVWAYTPTLPAFYWGAKSQEQIIKQLCEEYSHITSYVDEMTRTVNTLIKNYNKFAENVAEELKDVKDAILRVENTIENIGENSTLVYDPTQGLYVDSKIAMRNMYRELSVFGARVSQIADKQVSEIGKHRVDEVSAVGNLTIFNDNVPRVTDKVTGEKYPPLNN